jgi:Outer membrane protein beta-barrel domain
VLALLAPNLAHADWLVKPFAGVSIASSHGLVDLEQAAGRPKPFVGVAVGWQPTTLGFEVEFATAPGFFKHTGDLLDAGRLATVMGNVTWLLPRPGSAARLRAYVSAGAGVVHVTIEDALGAFSSRSTLVAGNVGGGVIIRVRSRASLNADIKYFRSQYGDQNSASFGEEFVTFTRLAGGVTLRF